MINNNIYFSIIIVCIMYIIYSLLLKINIKQFFILTQLTNLFIYFIMTFE